MGKIKYYILIILALCFYSVNAQSQTEKMSEKQAIALALQKSGTLNDAKLNIEQQKANIGGAFQLEPLELEYRKVKVNPATKVREISATQNFGSILGHIKRYKLAKSEVDLAQTTAKISEKEVIKQVRSLYQQWHYLYALKNLLAQQSENVRKIKTIAEKRYETGEIGGLENDITALQSLSVQSQQNSVFKEFTEIENQLKSMLQLQKVIEPQSEFPKPLSFEFSEELSPLFSEVLEKSSKVASDGVSLAKSVYLPSISAGLINRKAGTADDFRGFVVGLQIPLPLGSNRATVKKQKIRQQEVAFDNKAAEIEIQNRKESLASQLVVLKKEIATINKTFDKAKKFIDKLAIAYQTGEVGAYQYNQSFDAYFEVMQNYLALINTYNQMVVEYEFYVN